MLEDTMLRKTAVLMTPVRCGLLFAITLWVLTGCGASRETAVVTERPPPDTTRLALPEAPVGGEFPVTTPAGYDTVQARRFDKGRMWTFDDPPVEYFRNTYDFDPDSAWFRKAQQGALRFADYCSASFVSSSGLVLTNHHCARESITKVSTPGEDLLKKGFYAQTVSNERKVPDLYVDQLIDIQDVTERIARRARKYAGDKKRAREIQQRTERIQKKMTRAAKKIDERRRVEVVKLYHGSRYAAYTYRRYEDVRLVFAPALRVAFFGGTADNFTYPRYAFDAAFFRVYDEDGEPLRTSDYFAWSLSGTQEGDPVFAVGNPGSTSRLETVSQLQYERDYTLPHQLRVLHTRADLLADYIEDHPEAAEKHDLRNALFTLRNSIKSKEGQLKGLRDPYLMARRAAAEKQLADELTGQDSLHRAYTQAVKELRAVQTTKESIASQSGAFTYFGSPNFSSHVLTRALYGYYYSLLKQRGAPPDRLSEIRSQAMKVTNWPAALEADLIAARLRELRDYLGANDPTLEKVLKGRSPQKVGERLAERTALTDSSSFRPLLDDGYLKSGDPSVPVIKALGPLFLNQGQQSNEYQHREDRLQAQIARVRLMEGDAGPPDATFTLRISDGRVQGYEYNGTRAPAHTTFYGMYNHHYTYGPESDWGLPSSWLSPPDAFTRSTPLDLVSTNDITGGNSGSPLLDRNLKLVGVAFDSNIEALSGAYLYTSATARAISVDSRAILEALDDFYEDDRLARELVEQHLYETEAAAEAKGEDVGS